MNDPRVDIYVGDALRTLKKMPDKHFQMCVTSPPYWNLRDYRVKGQIGREKTPQAYIRKLVKVFREVRRVLRDDGTLWVNMGDIHVGSGAGRQGFAGVMAGRRVGAARERNRHVRPKGLKDKDLVGLPWMLAFALREDGWWLRRDIIWEKDNPMPESAKDRPSLQHEYIFLLSKRKKYFYDAEAVKEPATSSGRPGKHDFAIGGWAHGKDVSHATIDHTGKEERSSGVYPRKVPNGQVLYRNKRSVWHMSTVPYLEAHFATFPPALPRTCIAAGSSPRACGKCGAPDRRVVLRRIVDRTELPTDHPEYRPTKSEGPKEYAGEGQTGAGRRYSITRTLGWKPACRHYDDWGTGKCHVLDPFAGAATTALETLSAGRDATLIELSPRYVDMQVRRIVQSEPPVFFSLDYLTVHK